MLISPEKTDVLTFYNDSLNSVEMSLIKEGKMWNKKNGIQKTPKYEIVIDIVPIC